MADVMVKLSGEERDLLTMAIRASMSSALRSQSKATLQLVKDAYGKQHSELSMVLRKVNGEVVK